MLIPFTIPLLVFFNLLIINYYYKLYINIVYYYFLTFFFILQNIIITQIFINVNLLLIFDINETLIIPYYF